MVGFQVHQAAGLHLISKVLTLADISETLYDRYSLKYFIFTIILVVGYCSNLIFKKNFFDLLGDTLAIIGLLLFQYEYPRMCCISGDHQGHECYSVDCQQGYIQPCLKVGSTMQCQGLNWDHPGMYFNPCTTSPVPESSLYLKRKVQQVIINALHAGGLDSSFPKPQPCSTFTPCSPHRHIQNEITKINQKSASESC